MNMITKLAIAGLFGFASSASANLVSNGDFEADLESVGEGFTNSVSVWFDENGTSAGDGDFVQWDGSAASIPDDANGEVWGGLGIGNAGQGEGALYQAIGTYTSNRSLAVSLNVGDRSNREFPDIQVNLYSGNVTGSDGSSLSDLGATLLDQSALITASELGFDDTDTNTHTASVAPFVLNTGTSGIAGETLWLEIRTAELAASGTHQALIDDIVASEIVVTWTGGGDAVSLFQEANWDAAGGVLSGDYVSKTGATPYDLVIDIPGSVGGGSGWDGTLDLDNVGSITVSEATFKMSATAVIKNGSASVTGSNFGYIQGTLDNADFWSNWGLSLLGPMHLINGSTLEATWFAGGNGVSSLDGGSTLIIREDADGTFNNNTVDFLDVESKIVYNNLSRTVAEVTSEHVSHFTVNGLEAVVGVNIDVFTNSVSGYTTVKPLAESAYDVWAASYGLTNGLAAKDYDVEPDGLENLLEYALGGNPTNADDSAVLPVSWIENNDGTNWFYYVHNERNDPSLTYAVTAATKLLNPDWNTNGVEWVGESVEVDGFRSVTNRTDTEVDTTFFRLEVSQ